MSTPTAPKNWKQMTWLSLFDACTPKEREEMVSLVLAMLESRKDTSIEIYKRDPSLLAGLSVSALREMSESAANDAHKWIIANYPQLAPLLIAFECLTSFSMGKDETINYNDLTDIISSLKEVWSMDHSVSVETKGQKA